MRLRLFFLLFGCSLLPSINAQSAQAVPMDAAHWELLGPDLGFVTHLGKPALRVHGGTAVLRKSDFATGTIEFDVAFQREPEFAGFYFHSYSNDAEFFYLRPHESGADDSTQYMPIVGNDDTWQIFSGPEFESNENFVFGGWNHVRVEVYEHSAEVFLNGAPSLRIAELKGKLSHGEITLNGSSAKGNTTGQIFFSNFRYREGVRRAPADMPKPIHFAPTGLITGWRVSKAMTEAEAMARAAKNEVMEAAVVPVESNGICNISRADIFDPKTNTAVAGFRVSADKARTAMLRVGYSDRVTVFVNGVVVYTGNSTQYSRDARFLGVVGLFDTIAVPLRAGENAVAFVVSERNGGWATEAQFVDLGGLNSPDLAL